MSRTELQLCAAILLAPVLLAAQPAKAPDSAAASPPDERVTLDDLLRRSRSDESAEVSIDELSETAKRHYDDAVDFEADGKLDEAAESLDAALRDAQAYPFELLELFARVKFRQGRAGEARVIAELASRLRPDDPDVSYVLGKLALEEGLKDAAAAHFLRAIAQAKGGDAKPRAIAALYELARLLESGGQLVAAADACARFDLTLAHAPAEARRSPELGEILADHPRGLLRRAVELYHNVGMKEASIAAARQVSSARPDETYAKRVLADALLDGGQAAEAATLARALIKADGTGPIRMAVRTSQAADKLDAWVAELVRNVKTGPGADLAARAARAIDALELSGKSIPLWRALADARPDDCEMAWALATAQKDARDLPAAIATLTAHLRHPLADTTESTHCPSLARLAAWMNSRVEGVVANERPDPAARDSDGGAETAKALAALACGQDERAEKCFESALAGKSPPVLAYVGRGLLNLRRGQWRDASADAAAALERDPDLAIAHWLTAEAESGLDRHEEAKAAYQRALKLNPDDVDCQLALARLERRAGDMLAAQRFLQDAWEADQTRGDVLEELVASYLEGGKIDLAAASLDEAEGADVDPDALRRTRTVLRFAPDLTSDAYLAELRRQRAAYPSDRETAYALASSLFALDEYEQVGAIADELTPRDDRDRERLTYLRARLQLRRLDPAGAIKLLEPLAARYPNRRATLSVLAGAYAADFRLEDARAVYARLLALPLEGEQRDQVRRNWVGSLADFMAYDDAIRLLDEWTSVDPNDKLAGELKLEVLTLAERGDGAIALAKSRLEPLEQRFNALIDEYRASLTGGSASPARLGVIEKELRELSEPVYTLREDLVQTALAFEQYDMLNSTLRGWLGREPGQMQLRAWIIETALAAKQPGDALAALRDMNPQSALDLARAVTWRARALVLQDKPDEASRELRNLLKEPPIRSNPRLILAVRRALVQTLVDDEDYQEAVRCTDEWLLEAASDPPMRYELLTLQRSIYLRAERNEDHVRVAEQLLELEPLDPALSNDLGYTLAESGGQLERASEMIRRAVAMEPLNPAYMDSLGWVYYQREDFEEARRWLSRATRMRTGQDSVVYDHLGDAAYRLGDKPSARECWEKSLALLEKINTEDRRPSDVELLAALRAKLDAMAAGEQPKLAPVASEHEEKTRP